MNSSRMFFPVFSVSRAVLLAGIAVTFAAARTPAQTPAQTPAPADQTQAPLDSSQPAQAAPVPTVSAPMTIHGRGRKKADPAAADDSKGKVVQSKDTKKSLSKTKKTDGLAGQDAKLPDKQLYDKAIQSIAKGRYDVARLDLQTMLNTYPDSQYQMRAKLAIADSWYKEGGTAALTQAESEYSDFRVFFPNVPEAAEAQMRIGDIYFRQMDKPDRDYAKALHSEEEYRRMLTDYPDSALIPQAKQRLREVQEVLASREADIAAFYATRENWAATIARYQTVVDTYPLYSHMDDVLIGLGDSYAAQGRYIRTLKLAEAPKARLEKLYDQQAADCYRKVVTEHSAAPHVEDARDRLAAMNLPIPEPTPEQIAASNALENSRQQYTFASKALLLVVHKPDTVTAARIGDPPLVDAKPTFAPGVVRKSQDAFTEAMSGTAAPVSAAISAPASDGAAATKAPADVPARPLALEDVPTEDGGPATSTPMTTAAPASTGTGTGLGVEIIPSSSPAAATPAATTPHTGTSRPSENLFGEKPAADTSPLPPTEQAADAPDRPNEVTGATAPAQAPRANGKRTKTAFDKADESSSKHKKKKGLKRLDPLPQ